MAAKKQTTAAQQLLALLMQAGASIKAEGTRLYVTPPEIAGRFAAQIRANKDELLAALAPEDFDPTALPRIENGHLIMPMHCPAKYRHWAGGQSLYLTLAELNAPLEVWARYAGRGDDLVNGLHSGRCDGRIQSGSGFLFCTECGYYQELKNEGEKSNE